MTLRKILNRHFCAPGTEVMTATTARWMNVCATINHASPFRAWSDASRNHPRKICERLKILRKAWTIFRHRNHRKLHLERNIAKRNLHPSLWLFWEKKSGWNTKSDRIDRFTLCLGSYTCLVHMFLERPGCSGALDKYWIFTSHSSPESFHFHFLHKFYFFLLFWNGSKEIVDHATCNQASKQVSNTHLPLAYLESLHEFSPKVSTH